MTTPLRVNLAKFYSRLNAFRVDGEFTDVTIQCADGGDSFQCHRVVLAVASDYFKDMFSNTFKERTADSVILRVVSTATFQEVLRFVYTGDAKIDCDNFQNMIGASEFFLLSGLRDSCISFVMQNMNKFMVQNLLNTYLHARANKEHALDSILRPQLADKLETFYRADEFLELPLDVYSDITEHRSDSLARVCMATSSFISVDAIPTRSKLSGNVPVVMENNDSSTALHIYITFAQEDLIQIYSIDGSTGTCTPAGTVFHAHANLEFTTIALNNALLYRLLYYGGQYGPAPGADEPDFAAYKSADMRTALSLKLPPIHFEFAKLCAVRNNIYVYDEGLYGTSMGTRNTSSLDDEQIDRGILAYNCEVDDWFPVHPMRVTSQWASMTALDDTLFIIGGYPLDDDVSENYAQAYDRREGVWRELPETKNSYCEASACCVQRKIYVFGGARQTNCERYDPVAGRWESLADMAFPLPMTSKSITYRHKIWVFNRDLIPENEDNRAAIDRTDENEHNYARIDPTSEYGGNAAISERRNLYFQTGRNRLSADLCSPTFEWSKKCVDLRRENPISWVDGVVFKKNFVE